MNKYKDYIFESGGKLEKESHILNARYELVYGGEFRWTSGGQLSYVLQQKAKQFLRKTDITYY